MDPVVDVAKREAQIAAGAKSPTLLTEIMGTTIKVKTPVVLTRLAAKLPGDAGTALRQLIKAGHIEGPKNLAVLEQILTTGPWLKAMKKPTSVKEVMATVRRGFNSYGIQRLKIGERVFVLSEAQEKATKVLFQAIATRTWTQATKKLLERFIAWLQMPRELIVKALSAATNAHVGKFMRQHPTTGNIGLAAAEGLIGGAAGGWTGIATGMDIAGRGLNKVVQRLLGDTSGKALRSLLSRATLGAPEALKRAAQAAGAGNEELYRSIMWTALKATDVNEYLQQVVGSRGVNASGPRVQQGYGS
jgi:hypothetical protein